LELHISPVGGDSGFLKNYHRVKKECFWDDLKTDVQRFVAECLLIQVDIGGHPPFPTGSKQFSGNFGNLLFLAVFNFQGHFEALNDVFGKMGRNIKFLDISSKMNLLDDTFPMGYHAPKTEIVCKSYDPGKLMY
jgi:hypothetical protein